MNQQNPATERQFTDGVRGIANSEVTAEMALRCGRAAVHVVKHRQDTPAARDNGKPKIVIGRDTRRSGPMLEMALSSGILSMGGDVLLIGLLPTPGIAYMTRFLHADAGVAITASHNSYEDNGIKFFAPDGGKLVAGVEAEIEHLAFNGEIDRFRPIGAAIGKDYRIEDALRRYIEFALSTFPKGLTLDGMRIVCDVAHGAAYQSTPCILRKLGAEVVVYNNAPDGTNINLDCGSLHTDRLCQAVLDHRAHLGIAHDGDADRVVLVDENARVVDGDDILAIAGVQMLSEGTLRYHTLVATVMSNGGLDEAIGRAGGHVVRTAVGDKNVIDKMRRLDANLGGEQSGHVIFRDYTTTGDGIITALQILRIMLTTGQPLSELSRVMTRFPQVTRNVRVREKTPLESFPEVQARCAAAESALGPTGRLIVRYSGTETVCRVTLEGRDESLIQQHAQNIAATIDRLIGVAPC
jgi:phosphoglucosamine mutase